MRTLIISAVLLGAAASASAQTLYSNGPIAGSNEGWDIYASSGYAVADSFTLANPTTIGSATVGLWFFTGENVASLDWSITTTAQNGTVLASGSASSFTSSYFGSAYGEYDVYAETFSINAAIPAGTYWLTLDNAVATASGAPVYWDENDGPSAYAQYSTANGLPADITGSESFTLSGQTVPEPTTLALAGLGGVALLLRKRK